MCARVRVCGETGDEKMGGREATEGQHSQIMEGSGWGRFPAKELTLTLWAKRLGGTVTARGLQIHEFAWAASMLLTWENVLQMQIPLENAPLKIQTDAVQSILYKVQNRSYYLLSYYFLNQR